MTTTSLDEGLFDQHGRFRFEMPRFVILFVNSTLFYLVVASAGIRVGIISALIAAVFSASLCNIPPEDASGGDSVHNIGFASRLFSNFILYEARFFRNQMIFFGRQLHNTLEFCHLEEMLYVACILREHQWLLILLVCGIASMMVALISGLDGVNLPRAFFFSLSCYSLTTVLVAKTAIRTVSQSNLHGVEAKLTYTDVELIMESVPVENFILDEQLETCTSQFLTKMLQNRSDEGVLKGEDGDMMISLKHSLINQIRKKRNYNDSCCICLAAFEKHETIRVLPVCHHEFHKTCMDQWAHTFSGTQYSSYLYERRGRPTCPLCNTVFG